MTLQEAFKIWCEVPRNITLANTYRTAIQSVLMKRYADTELCLIDKQFARNIFAGSDAVQETKSRAASILVYLLQWGSDNGHCRRPSFDYSIAREVKPADKPKGRKKPQEEIKPQNTQKDTEEKIDTDDLLNTDYKDYKDYKETAAEQPQANPSIKSIKSVSDKKNICDTQKSPCESVSSVAKEESAAKPKRTIRKVDDDICQLDPKTLEVIKRWPHALRIKQELGVHNVVRAIERCGQAGGFYWTYSKDLNTFAARLADRKEHNAEVHKNHCAQMRALKTPTQRDRDTEEKKKASKKTAAASPPELGGARGGLNKRKDVSPAQTTPNPSRSALPLATDEGRKNSGGEAAAQVNERSEEPRRSVASKALEVFTDDELFAELERRGWHGYFSRTEIVTIGKN